MNKIILVLFIGLCVSISAKAQKVDYPLNNRVIINYPDRIVYAYFDVEKKDITISDDRYYYWFSANDIKRTRGGYDGKILHGGYTEYYNNRNLREKGLFKFGLKKGHWKSWYANGELKDVVTYHKGMKDGKFITYYSNGKVHQKGIYDKDLLHKKYTVYDSTGTVTQTERYKKGILLKKKERKLKIKASKAAPAVADKNDKTKSRKRFGLFKRKKDVTPAVDPALDKDKKMIDKNGNKEVDKNKKKEEPKRKKEKKSSKDKIKVKKVKKIVPGATESNSI